ncbi:MAG: beta-lactamase family protein [Gammaproteobacteria bacterium]|nr:beta-lactamase family protein [Gammaproteobacteria bacterium]
MRFVVRVLQGILALILLSLLALFVAQPTLTTRLVGLAFGGDQGPRQVIAGGTVPALAVVPEGQRSIPADVLDKAVDWGATMESHALLVWQGGALQLEHYYPGHDAGSITPTQSMHKSVLALLVGIAIDQGLIRSVDDTAATYVSEWAGDERRDITIRQMLQQASGIDFPGFTGLIRMTLGGNVAPFTFSRGVSEPAGQRFEYNNINPEVLGILIQRVSGKPYSQYLAENLWQYVSEAEGKVLIDSEAHGIPITFCCLDAPARTWLRFGLLHLDGGRVGDRQVVPARWMKDVVTPSPTNPNYGYFTWLGTKWEKVRPYNSRSSATAFHSEPFAAPDVVYFDGFGGQRVYIVPSKELVIVHTGPLRQDWDDAILPNMIIRALP